MTDFKPQDPDYENHIRDSFLRQTFIVNMGAVLTHVSPGRVEIELPFSEDLTQQHGFLHAGALTAIVDSACGYAALSLMPAYSAVLSVEYKINLLAPAICERVIAQGLVIKPGKNIIVCSGEAIALNQGEKKIVAKMLGTMMAVRDRPDLRG